MRWPISPRILGADAAHLGPISHVILESGASIEELIVDPTIEGQNRDADQDPPDLGADLPPPRVFAPGA